MPDVKEQPDAYFYKGENRPRRRLLNPSFITGYEIRWLTHKAKYFAHYRRLETLTDYVILPQYQPFIEHYTRQGDQWVLTEVTEMDAVLRLPSVECEVPLTLIYERVEFTPDPKMPALGVLERAMTTITLTADLEQAIEKEAQTRGLTASEVVLEALRKTFLPTMPFMPADDTLNEWELSIRTAATQISAISDNEQAGLAAIEKELKQNNYA